MYVEFLEQGQLVSPPDIFLLILTMLSRSTANTVNASDIQFVFII